VVSLQKALNKQGAKPQIIIDGVFGEETFKALRNFQKKMDLRVDGVAGPETFKALGIKGI
jgi:peptidoglycan hydrolase-like protein with peptidoglycan-binding domain